MFQVICESFRFKFKILYECRKLLKKIDVIEKFFQINNSLILEIGTHKGDFSIVLLEKFKPKKLVLVDPWIAEKEKIYQSSWYGNFDGGGQKILDSYYQNVKKNLDNKSIKNK